MALRAKKSEAPEPDYGAMVQSVEGLVRRIARKFFYRAGDGGALAIDDLISAGREGAFHAAKRFEPQRKWKFTTYAVHWIKAYVRREVENIARTIRAPSHVQKQVFNHLSDDPNKKLRSSISGGVVSLNAPSRDGDDRTLEDRIVDSADSSEDVFLDKEKMSRARDLFSSVLLDYREREVLKARFRDDQTLKEAGIAMGISRERVRQIEARALAKLRRYLKKQSLV